MPTSTAPRTTAIIVTYNSRPTIGRTLEVCREIHQAKGLDCIVIDNASHDGTADWVRQEHPWVRVVSNKENRGFARGCNQGFALAMTPYSLVLNPDAVLPLAGLQTMERFMDEHPRAGIAGPATRRQRDDRFQWAGGLPTPWKLVKNCTPFLNRQAAYRTIVPDEPPFRTDWICGAILLLRKAMLEALEGFDPSFFLYYEETDLCRRAVLAGWEIWAIGQAVGEHVCSASAIDSGGEIHRGCLSEHFYRSRYYYMRKHFGFLSAVFGEVGELLMLSVLATPRWLLRRNTDAFAKRVRAPILSLPERVPGE